MHQRTCVITFLSSASKRTPIMKMRIVLPLHEYAHLTKHRLLQTRFRVRHKYKQHRFTQRRIIYPLGVSRDKLRQSAIYN
jgi:hypothetical protein